MMETKHLLYFVVAMIPILSLCIGGCGPSPTDHLAATYEWRIPNDMPKPQVPEDNPMSSAKVELGRHLFYDTALSANQQQNCASCHLQSHAFAEPLSVSIGSTGEPHKRNAPALVNIAYNKTLTWAHDGLTNIESQLLLPLFGEQPIELGVTGHETEILGRLQRPPYPALFNAAFGHSQANFVAITQALASFVRSLISLNSPFDHYAYQADDLALNEQELAGMALFFSERLECHHCHGGFNFTQSTSHEKQPLDRRPFHNTGLYYTDRPELNSTSATPDNRYHKGYPIKDRGLSEVTIDNADDGRFRAPSLRNISLTAPYMHDGSVATLSDVIDIYAAGGRNITEGLHQGDGRMNPLKSPFIKGFELTPAEKQQLLAFLNTLTDISFIEDPQYANPWLNYH